MTEVCKKPWENRITDADVQRWQEWGRYMRQGGITYTMAGEGAGDYGTVIDKSGYSDPTAVAAEKAWRMHRSVEVTHKAWRDMPRNHRRVMWMRYAAARHTPWQTIAEALRRDVRTVQRMHKSCVEHRNELWAGLRKADRRETERLGAWYDRVLTHKLVLAILRSRA